VVSFRAGPGEQNHVTITESPGGVFTVVDSIPLTTPDCDQVDQFTAECTIQYGIGVAAELGDLDDTLVIDAFWIDRLEAGTEPTGSGCPADRVSRQSGAAPETTCSWTLEGGDSTFAVGPVTTDS
jgi:hypothetical protein